LADLIVAYSGFYFRSERSLDFPRMPLGETKCDSEIWERIFVTVQAELEQFFELCCLLVDVCGAHLVRREGQQNWFVVF